MCWCWVLRPGPLHNSMILGIETRSTTQQHDAGYWDQIHYTTVWCWVLRPDPLHNIMMLGIETRSTTQQHDAGYWDQIQYTTVWYWVLRPDPLHNIMMLGIETRSSTQHHDAGYWDQIQYTTVWYLVLRPGPLHGSMILGIETRSTTRQYDTRQYDTLVLTRHYILNVEHTHLWDTPQHQSLFCVAFSSKMWLTRCLWSTLDPNKKPPNEITLFTIVRFLSMHDWSIKQGPSQLVMKGAGNAAYWGQANGKESLPPHMSNV
jgi:hypothetical protein